jgi:biopolymer transport protein ExbB
VAIEAVILYNMLNVLAGRLQLQLKLLTEEFLEIVKEVRTGPAGAQEP